MLTPQLKLGLTARTLLKRRRQVDLGLARPAPGTTGANDAKFSCAYRTRASREHNLIKEAARPLLERKDTLVYAFHRAYKGI